MFQFYSTEREPSLSAPVACLYMQPTAYILIGKTGFSSYDTTNISVRNKRLLRQQRY